MNNRFLPAVLVGGVVHFLLGWLVFGMALMSTYRSMMTPEATAAMKEPAEIWAYGLGSLTWALLLTWLYSRWASISTFRTGAIAGAVIGFLVALSMGFNGYASMKMWTSFSGMLIDPLGAALVSGITGGVVGWVLGYQGRK